MKSILSNEDLYEALDDLLREPKPFWESFYEDRTKDIPFFTCDGPDENLTAFIEGCMTKPVKVLELGCGPGRNAIYLAKQGCQVDAVDLSEGAINWAKERAELEGVDINFICESVFSLSLQENTYDLIYDCGLFHHLAPHRRLSYIDLVKSALKDGGHFGLICFNEDGAVATSDYDIYKERSMNRGIGYSKERLISLFESHFDITDIRQMKKIQQPSAVFGEDFLWTVLMQKK
ncbi:bifunctional 2-polyprenyl-6-hydroxyphenol methylase/3-demethylubiquinol 3-O-methyltransferase UbiG [Jeotgalibacillus sp. R-1-5s-1]|uniref:class I SAM-dependent methyltransferase n=1 Tax=Jeotgalibacillus sp. R-1-5s-1 TaxID=2555897 RepID=UPI00106C8A21|nr:class I SAM-dependent methyltransferase [Jeotgalibacillus sp. R-1-5s-1]TFD93582.1 class I SAM-dependent methyltransferase [Jeotgalibacillus sp. R-1-5s-1]